MIENTFTVLKGDLGVVQVSVEQLDDSPELVRFQVREACGDEEYEVDCSLELDELEYLANRILDAIAYQRRQNTPSRGMKSLLECSEIQRRKERGELTEDEALYLSIHSLYRNNPEIAGQEPEKIRIIAALAKHNGNRKLAAEELGISERTFYRKAKVYGII